MAGPAAGKPLSIGSGFKASSFKYDQYGGLMDPLVMVDHYTMTEPTFGAHPHAGMSAVSVLFEDCIGAFNNRDSLGNVIDLAPGDLYWLKAGRGAVHDEKPLPGSRTHGLQIFVNLPAGRKQEAPDSLHVKSADIPCIEGPGLRVRVVLGESNGVRGAESPALPLTILDGALEAGTAFSHRLAAGQAAWLHARSGALQFSFAGRAIQLPEGEALALRNGDTPGDLALHGATRCHFALLSGEPLLETFVQRGPFVMSNDAEIDRLEAAYQAGELGTLD